VGSGNKGPLILLLGNLAFAPLLAERMLCPSLSLSAVLVVVSTGGATSATTEEDETDAVKPKADCGSEVDASIDTASESGVVKPEGNCVTDSGTGVESLFRRA